MLRTPQSLLRRCAHFTSRPILPIEKVHPAIRPVVINKHEDFVQEVQAAVAANDVVVVGMGWNPFPKKARRILDGAGIPYKYIAHGNYLQGTYRRNSVKLWTGFPTFPQIFVKGILIGGASDLQTLLSSGELKSMLDAPRAQDS